MRSCARSAARSADHSASPRQPGARLRRQEPIARCPAPSPALRAAGRRGSAHHVRSRRRSFGGGRSGARAAPDEAVFWSGIPGGNIAAGRWAAQHGGTTLEQAVAKRGLQLPKFNPRDPAAVSAWRKASEEFAKGARGDVIVLQVDEGVRLGSIWAKVEYPALISNPNVTSITALNPRTGGRFVLCGGDDTLQH